MSTVSRSRHATANHSMSSTESSRILIPNQSATEMVWELVSPLLWKLVVFYTKVFLLVASVVMFAVTTVLLYSLVYWLAVPKRLHTYPVFFDFAQSSVCANVTLADRQWEGLARPVPQWDRPTAGFDFDVSLTIEFPSTEHNVHAPPVMFETTALLRDHHAVAKTARPFLVPHTSWLGRLFRDFLTMTATGLYLYRDRMTGEVMLLDSFPVHAQEALSYVHVCMQPPLHVYSGTLNFVSKLSGLRYLLAHHPIAVGVVVVAFAVGAALLVIVIAYVVRYVKRKDEVTEFDEFREPLSPVSPREEMLSSDTGAEADNGLRRRGIRD